MLKFRFSWLSVSFFSFFSHCGQAQQAKIALPTDLPIDLVIEYHQGGGMRPQSEGAVISLKEAHFAYSYSQAKNKIALPITEQELQKLYKIFVNNKFNQIRTRQEVIHDRGGTNITLRFGKNHLNISDSGGTLIEKDWQNTYNTCLKAVTDFIESKVQAQKQSFTIRFDESITETGHLISCYIEDSQIRYYSELDGAKNTLQTQILSGEHNIYMQLVSNTQPAHERKSIAYTSFNFEKKSDTKGITFYFHDQQLTYKLW